MDGLRVMEWWQVYAVPTKLNLYVLKSCGRKVEAGLIFRERFNLAVDIYPNPLPCVVGSEFLPADHE